MTTNLELHYYFDPICGWCYASAPSLAAVAEHYGDSLRMRPNGLFYKPRPVADIADHAWRNDQRIGELYGQTFSDAYHQGVMRAPEGVLTSRPLTLALVALGEIDRALEPRLLHAAQLARYVDGQDTSRYSVTAEIAAQVATAAGQSINAAVLTHRLQQDTDLHRDAEKRIMKAQKDMVALGIQGVPQLVIHLQDNVRIVSGEDLYVGGATLLESIRNTEGALNFRA